ncbi:TIGR03085 family metal-binding protein [Rothia sp. CCM 9416]|uniref:TIGR03085 family metal-binding protein n=1 Tax=Rothia sp. CCM 9416 TaxID=3402655 RepID=UPI003AECE1FF
MTALSPLELVTSERQALCLALSQAGPLARTLCEGWETRHMLAHLLLRESQPLAAAGVVGGPLAARTDRLTGQLADDLAESERYEQGLARFQALPGYLGMRSRAPQLDLAMNLLEYFVHTEDVRRAADATVEPRTLQDEVQQKLWEALRKRARFMAGKKFPPGLVLDAPGYRPSVHTVIAPHPGQKAQILTGQPGELVLYLFGREDASQATLAG